MLTVANPALAQTQKPNIILIFGDDIGYLERRRLRARDEGRGMPTPEHRPHRRTEGMTFLRLTMASRAARRAERRFITGRNCPIRTRHDDRRHSRARAADCPRTEMDPRVRCSRRGATQTVQFGKNHLGDRNEFLPTVHGLRRVVWQPLPPQRGRRARRARLSRPERSRATLERYRQVHRDVCARAAWLHAWATDVDDPTTDPKFGRVAKQKIENTGALTRKRMETVRLRSRVEP